MNNYRPKRGKNKYKMKVYIDAYLAQNLGDDLFIDILTKRYPNDKFYAISKNKNRYNMKNLKVISNSYLYRALKKFEFEKYLANMCDLVVSIGGSMFMEKNDANRNFSLGKNKRYILGTNFGPYKTKEYYNNLYGVFKQAEDVCFREKYSYELFKNLPNVRYAPDIVFSMNVDNIKITNRKRAIISVISCKYKLDDKYSAIYRNTIIKLIEFLVKQNYDICLMSFCKEEKDEEEIEEIITQCKDNIKEKLEKYYYNGNINEALNVLGDSCIIFGSRFHANILGLLLQKTIIPIIYSDKTLHVLEDMNIKSKYIDIRNLDKFSINSLTEKDLNNVINIQEQQEKAKEHFKELDIALGRIING